MVSDTPGNAVKKPKAIHTRSKSEQVPGQEASMTKKSSEQKYTDPDLREEIKEDIKQSDKGGRPGQWSARKSQLLAREYERQGGGYTGEKDESQRNLKRWTEEDWRTQ